MRTIENWENITPSYGGEGRKEIPGGYIVKITYVEDVKEKEYLRIEWDYTDGEMAGTQSEGAYFERPDCGRGHRIESGDT